MNVDLTPFIAESLSTNKKIYKDIDKIYNTNKIMFINLAKENEFYNHLISQEGNVEQEYYFKKALGILLATNNDASLSQALFTIIKKGWRYLYTYVENHKLLSVSDFLNDFIKKNKGINNVADDELNSNVVMLILLARSLSRDIDTDDEMYIQGLTSFVQRIEHYKENNRINILKLSRENQKRIKELERKIRKEGTVSFIPSGYRLPVEKYNGIRIDIDKLTKDDKFFSSFEYIFDLENISLISVVGENYLEFRDIQELIFCYVQFHKDGEIINIEELKMFLYPAIQIRYLCKEYKRSKRYFFDHFNESLYSEISEFEKENKELKKFNFLLQDEVKELKLQLEKNKIENKRLNQKLIEAESNKTELVALREFIFNLDKKQELEVSDKIDYDKINSIKGVIVGGHNSLHVKLKEVLTEWTFISLENIGFDEKLLLNADKIYIYTDYLNHGMYNKVMSSVNKNELKIQYIEGNTNVNLVLKQIQKGL